MPKAVDLRGQRFDRLVVKKRMGSDRHGNATWECECDCGNKTVQNSSSLRRGLVQSCGCLHSEKSRDIIKGIVYKGTIPKALEKTKSRINSTGRKGVYEKKNGKYRAQIMLRGRAYHLGMFDNLDDAIKARKQAEEELFKPVIEEYKNEVMK